MRRIMILLGLLLPVLASAATAYTPGPWKLYRSGSIVLPYHTSAAACDAALRAQSVTSGTVQFKCQQTTTATFVTGPPPPAPVDCVVGPWSTWTGGAWSACSGGQQTRQESRMREIVVMPSGGGAACPALIEVRNATQSCTSPPGGGVNNPDNWPIATTTYKSRNYDTQNSSDMWQFSQDVVRYDYLASGGYNGSGAWKVTPTPTSSGEHEDNAGWLHAAGGTNNIPAGTNTMVFDYRLYMSSAILNAIVTSPGGFWNHSNKILDVFMRGSGGGFDDATRQVITFKNESGGPKFSHIRGGAGVHFVNDGVNANPDFRQYADQWVRIIHVFDRSGTYTYIKPEGQNFRLILRRRANDTIPGDGGGPYTYNSNGWTMEPGRTLWGYWDDINGSFDANRFVKIDDLRVLNGWPAN